MEDKLEFKAVYDLSKEEDLKRIIYENESGLYSSKNEDGEDVVVSVEQNEGCVIYTNQSNGWIRFEEYNKHGLVEGSGFEGKWNK